jgi:uncharacterized membrane protein
MEEVSKDALTLLTQLMPGFLTAWVVYGLTTYTKPAQFERIIQALIYSFIINAVVAFIGIVSVLCGKIVQWGSWNATTEVIVSAVIAILFGIGLAYFTTNDSFFAFARKIGITSRTPYPSEWYGAFASKPATIVLHLQGDRRIQGYPLEWPTEPTVGHFRLTLAAWLDDANVETPITANYSILIAAKEVEMVEISNT